MFEFQFFNKYSLELIVKINQKEILTKAGSKLSGVCNAMVSDWFRRIVEGRRTWLEKKSRDRPPGIAWQKKAPRLIRMQTGKATEEDNKLSLMESYEEHEEAITEHMHTEIIGEMFTTFDDTVAGKIVAAVMAERKDPYRPEDYVPDLFYRLHLRSTKKGHGHQVGIHREPVEKEAVEFLLLGEGAEEAPPSMEVEKQNIHFFDPNIGEFRFPQHRFQEFLVDWYSTVYTGLLKSFLFGFDYYAVSNTPIYWRKRGSNL